MCLPGKSDRVIEGGHTGPAPTAPGTKGKALRPLVFY